MAPSLGAIHRRFGLSAREALDVARPGDGDRDVAGGEVLGVVVAGELADLAALAGLLDLGRGGLARRRRWPSRDPCPSPSITSPSVSRISVSIVTWPLNFGIEDVVDAGQLAAGLLRVVADTGHAREPRHAVLPARIEAHVLHVVHQVGLVGELGVVERRDVAELDQAARHPVGQDDDLPVDALVPLERLVDLGEELVVVVDVLGVLGLDARWPSRSRAPSACRCRAASWRSAASCRCRGGGGRVAAGCGRTFLAAATRASRLSPSTRPPAPSAVRRMEPTAVDRLAEQCVQLVVSRVGLASAHGRTPAGVR